MVRRAVSGGVLFAAAAILPLCLLELLYVFLVRRPTFSSTGEALSFSLNLVVLLVSVAALLGAIEGLVVLAVSQLTSVLAKRRVAEPKWMALIYSVMALPGIAVLAARVFAGRRAQQVPAKDAIAIGLGVLGLAGAFATFRLIIAARDRFRIRRWGPAQAALCAPALLLVAAGLYVADQRVLAGLYSWFHLALAVLAVGFCQLAAGALHAAYRPRARWIARVVEPGLSMLVILAAVAGAAWSLSRVAKSESLRYLYYQHTAVQSKVLRAAASMNLLRSSSEPPPPMLPSAARDDLVDSLPTGPRHPEANIILLSVDALRADHLGTYGYSRRTTPNIDAWAKTAAVFERAYCQVPHTSFSVTSLMTGSYTYSLSTVDPGRKYDTLADVLRRYGYKTGGFFPPAVFYIDAERFTAFAKSLFGFEYIKFEYLDAEPRIAQVISFLKEYRSQRRLVWVHFFEPHETYERWPGIDFGPRAVDRYDGEVAYVDKHIGRLLDYVRRELPNTYVALTADHGEEFGEHGAHYHGNNLYDPQVRVPLIISGPGIAPRRIPGAAQIIDLPTTLLSLVDVPASARMRGTDLGPWLAGGDPLRLPAVFGEMDRKKLVVHQGHKLICDTGSDFCELYDLRADPEERRNLIQARPQIVADLRRELGSWMASHVPRPEGAESEAGIAATLDRGRQKDPGAVPALIQLCRSSQETRREAVRLLELMRAQAARPVLLQATSDTDPGVRIPALVGAALLGDVPSIRRLDAVLARTDLPPALRRDALLAQARAGDRRAAKPLADLLASTDDTYDKIEIIQALGELGDEVAAPALRAEVSRVRTALYAIEALGRVHARAAEGDLLVVLEGGRYTSWRKAAARAVGLISGPRARGALERVVQHEVESEVVAEALLALQLQGEVAVGGLRTLATEGWSCDATTCQLTWPVRCEDLGAKELLLLRAENAAAKGARPQTAPASLYCGDQQVARRVLDSKPVEVLRVGGQRPGPLMLRSAAKHPALRYAALRVAPR